MKLRGRAEAPDHGAEGAQSLSARGDNQEAPHGPLQRLLDGAGLAICVGSIVLALTEDCLSVATGTALRVAADNMELAFNCAAIVAGPIVRTPVVGLSTIADPFVLAASDTVVRFQLCIFNALP